MDKKGLLWWGLTRSQFLDRNMQLKEAIMLDREAFPT